MNMIAFGKRAPEDTARLARDARIVQLIQELEMLLIQRRARWTAAAPAIIQARQRLTQALRAE